VCTVFGTNGTPPRTERTLAAVRSTFRGAANVELLSARVGAQPMPADGEPIIGPVADVPGLYLAVMHSAVTLAPAELEEAATLDGCGPFGFFWRILLSMARPVLAYGVVAALAERRLAGGLASGAAKG
jgi:hypothetical protein